MPNLKFFLISILPAAGVILIALYFLPLAWSLGVFVLTIILIGLIFASGKPLVVAAPAEKNQTIRTEVSQNELESILNNFGDALIIYDENFLVLFFNTAAEKLFMLKTGDVAGTTIKPEAVDNQNLRLLAQTIFPTLA